MPIHSIHFCRDHLLIHAEQNILRIVGLKRYKLLHGGFNGVRSGMANIGSCFSGWAMGITGSEDGNACIWYTRSTASYKNALVTHRFGGVLCGVAWHKSQHVVALCSYEQGAPILVLEADRDKVVVGQQDMADALPEQSLITKDGKIDETVIFDGVELNEEQRQIVESRRSKRRLKFAKSLRSSLEETNPRLKSIFDETVGGGSTNDDEDVKPGRKGQDSDEESDDDEGESKSKGDLLNRVASQDVGRQRWLAPSETRETMMTRKYSVFDASKTIII